MAPDHDTRSRQPLLWVTDDEQPGLRERLEATVRDLALDVSLCRRDEFLRRVRNHEIEILGFELGDDANTDLALLRGLHERSPHVSILMASTNVTARFITEALECGASDVLSLPLSPQELQKSLLKLLRERARAVARPVIGDVITIYGARGGLGTTTLAVNLAVRLNQLTGSNTALVDLDLQRGDVAAFLNLSPSQSLASLATAGGEIDELFLHGTLSRHSSGVFVLPAPTQVEDADTVTRDEVNVALRLLRSRFRYSVVDTARTLTEVTLTAFEQTERLLLLTDLSIPGVRAARRIVELLARLEAPTSRLDLVITGAVQGPVKVEDAARTIGKEPFFLIPHDPAAATHAMNEGAPLNGTRDTALGKSIGELAAKLSGSRARPESATLLRRIFGSRRKST